MTLRYELTKAIKRHKVIPYCVGHTEFSQQKAHLVPCGAVRFPNVGWHHLDHPLLTNYTNLGYTYCDDCASIELKGLENLDQKIIEVINNEKKIF